MDKIWLEEKTVESARKGPDPGNPRPNYTFNLAIAGKPGTKSFHLPDCKTYPPRKTYPTKAVSWK
jgi:hypothetical protein